MNRHSNIYIIHFMVWDRSRKTVKYGGTFGSEYAKVENSGYLFMTYKATVEFKCFVGFMLKNKVQGITSS